MENIILKVEGVSKSFPGVKALDKVNLELRSGEVVALLGENGAGKSTLMKILSGVHKKDEGKIFFEGKEVNLGDPKESQNLGINIIYQEFNLFPDLTVAENIFITREPRNKIFNFIVKDKKLIEEAQKMLDMVHLNIDPTTKVSELSVAQQQMVEIAKVLSMNSKVVIMDEPTAALTDEEVQELFRVINELKKQGKGIIYISHRLEELEFIADRCTIFRDGKYIDSFIYKDTTIDKLITSMVGRDLDQQFPRVEVPRGKLALEVKKLKEEKKLDIKDFNLYEGEILGIYGLMGSGRTEFARAIFGADKVKEEDIYIYGKKTNIKNPEEAVKQGIGYITEDRKKDGLALGLSVEHNINLSMLDEFSRFSVMNDKSANQNAEKYVKDLRIKVPSIDQLTKNLSGGNQQKVVLGKWLGKNVKILILDEPTRGIDVGAKIEVYEVMNRLKKEGVAIIMISSELPEVIGMSDRIMVMRDGKFTGKINRQDATEEKLLSYAVSRK